MGQDIEIRLKSKF